MKTLYFDCFCGAGGDMLCGALVDAGADFSLIQNTIDAMDLAGCALRAEKMRKQGFSATQFKVDLDPDTPQPHRHLSDVLAILQAAQLPQRVRERAAAAFTRLAEAEAKAHGIEVRKVHFHEVGAVDAIADIVGVMLALEDLAPDRIVCSPLPVGSGTVTCAHGVMPVPAPATAILLQGVPLADCDETGELLTPTAAAVLTTVCDAFGPLPAMTVAAIGMGAGTRDGARRPNLVRVLIGDAADTAAEDTVTVLEANLDDVPGEWVGHCIQRLFEVGARDAWCVPIYMKKNRPGVSLTVLCTAETVADCEAVVFAETSTFGIRRHTARRTVLQRRFETVETAYGPVRMKIGLRQDVIVQAAPEYEDCVAAAARCKQPLRVIMDAARRAWQDTQAS